MGELEKQLQGLRDEKQKLEELAEERERGTAKGRTYEEAVAEAVDAIAAVQGDVADAVGDEPGTGGKKGDVLVGIDGASGPECGRIVFEAKDKRLSKPAFYSELDVSMQQRDADYAVLVVPGAEDVPAKLHSLREYQGDKIVAVFDPEDGSTLELEFAYRVARMRGDRGARGLGGHRRRGRARHGGAGGLGDGRRAQDQVPAHRRPRTASAAPRSCWTSSRPGCGPSWTRSTRPWRPPTTRPSYRSSSARLRRARLCPRLLACVRTRRSLRPCRSYRRHAEPLSDRRRGGVPL